jgi:hypothetical protein
MPSAETEAKLQELRGRFGTGAGRFRKRQEWPLGTERPPWMARAAPLAGERQLQFEQPDLDNSKFQQDLIGYARAQAVAERQRFAQMVRYFDGDGNGYLDLDEVIGRSA